MVFTDINFQTNALKLFSRILDSENPTEPIFPFEPQKPNYKYSKQKNPLKRALCSQVGISPLVIKDFLEALSENTELDMHSVIILKNGAVIASAEWGDYSVKCWKQTHSECKSIISLAIGVLIGDGALTLETKVSSVLGKRLSILSKIARPNLTVKNLLTMSSGVIFNELGAITEEDFLNAFFESGFKFIHGKGFDYNSMNSFVLAAVIKEVSGQSVSDFVSSRIFAPLSITDFYWEKNRRNLEMGGWGLFMLPEDMAKLGLLVLNGGRYKGLQIVPESYIKDALTPKMFPKGNGDYAYGYHIWLGKSVKSYLFNGMFGQNMLIYPENNIIIVSNASNGETFQQGPFYEIANRFFAKKPLAKPSLKDEIKLRKAIKALKNEKITLKDLPKEAKNLNKASFELNGGKHSPAGIMPLTHSVLRGNFTKGLTGISFEIKKSLLYVTFKEGNVQNTLPVGFKKSKISELYYMGEIFKAAIRGSFEKNKNNETVLNIRISFLELTNTRKIKITFKNNGLISLRLSEIPDKRFLTALINNALLELPVKSIAKSVKSLMESDAVIKRSDKLFSPEIHGKRVK